MKKTKFLITGFLLFTALTLFISDARAADICNPNAINNHYKGLYCGIRLNDNETADDKIVGTLASQFSMEKDIIKEILAGTICEKIKESGEEDIAELPESVRNACQPSGLSTEQALGGWSVFTDIRNAYEKENVIQKSADSLKFKFKASEQYWDGTITGNDAPFDLVVDLNLIEIVLFGSKAQWMQDVYSFPKKEEEEEGGEEVPMEGAVPSEEGAGETPAVPEPPAEGITVTEEGAEEIPPDCVPPNDPNADTGDGPSSNNQNPICGNGTVDILMAEECDDGNKQSGDGCNQYCRMESSGASDLCVDPEAVTFKQPSGTAEGEVEGVAGGDQTPACPPGTILKKGVGLAGPEAALPPPVSQSPEYPGPYLGGTLKQYPASNPPVCGPGESPVSITVAGETTYAKDDEGNVQCLPTEFCMNPDDVRTFLAALPPFLVPNGDWKALSDDDPKKKMIESIEALFCVNVKKENRPKSPYQMIEGCVDCHISAMVDALEKALETNVSPLVNTTSAFGISSKYGPAFSFNLNTAAKRALKYQRSNTAKTAIKKANEEASKSVLANTPPKLSDFTSDSPLKELSKQANQAEKTLTGIQEDTLIYGMSNQTISDQETGGRLIPLLEQMRDSFINIESKYEAMVGSLEFDEKEQCKP